MDREGERNESYVPGGNILVARAIRQSPLWRWDSEHLRLWIYLLTWVNASETPIVKDGVTIGYGQVLKAYRRIAEENEFVANRAVKRWSTARVKRMLDRFEAAEMISTLGTGLGTLITVGNFKRYQDFGTYRRELGTEPGTQLERSWNNNNQSIQSDPLNPPAGEPNTEEGRAVAEVFDYWEARRAQAIGKVDGPPMKPTSERLSKIRARLGEGYTGEQLKRAVDGCLSSPKNVKGGHTDIELICRNQGKVEQYLAWAQNGAPGSDSARKGAPSQPYGDGAARMVP